MKRYVRAAVITALVAGGLGSAGCAGTRGCAGDCGGCAGGDGQGTGPNGKKTFEDAYRNVFDVSWPDRYNYAARESIIGPFGQQVANGHFLDQTLWNWYFVPGTDKLTPGGFNKLDTLAHTTPAPDPRIYIQTARDIAITPENADKLEGLREELNAQRAASIRRYMAQQFGPPVPYEVWINDAPVPGLSANFDSGAYRQQFGGYKGGIGGSGGGQSPGGVGGGGGPSNTTGTPGAPSMGGGPGGGTGTGLPSGATPPPSGP